MCIELSFYNKNDLLDFKKWLDDKKLYYDYYDLLNENEYFIDEETIVVYDLNEYNNNYRSLKFCIDFFNKDNKLCYIDIEENKVASWKISRQS